MKRVWAFVIGFVVYPLSMPFVLHYFPGFAEWYLAWYGRYIELLAKVLSWS